MSKTTKTTSEKATLSQMRNKVIASLPEHVVESNYRGDTYRFFIKEVSKDEQDILGSFSLLHSRVENGSVKSTLYCSKCNKVSDVKPSGWYGNVSCPHCGSNQRVCKLDNSEVVVERPKSYHKSILLYADSDTEEVAFLLGMLHSKVTLPALDVDIPTKEDFERLYEAAVEEYSLTEPEIYFFNKKYGLRKMTSSSSARFTSSMGKVGGKFYTKDKELLNIMIKQGYVDKNKTQISTDDVVERLLMIDTEAASASAARATKKEAAEDNEDLLYASTSENMFNKDAKSLIIKNSVGINTAFIYSQNRTKTEYIFFCPDCGKIGISESEDSRKLDVECPDCGKMIRATNVTISNHGRCYGSVKQTEYLDLVVEPTTHNLVINRYAAENEIIADPASKYGYSIKSEVKFVGRLVFTDKKIIMYEEYTSSALKRKGTTSSYQDYKLDGIVINKLRGEDVIEIIKSSVFQKSGLIEYLSDRKTATPESEGLDLTYLYWKRKYPICEQLVKLGLNGLYSWFKRRTDLQIRQSPVNPKATDIRTAYGLSKTQAKIVNEHKLSYHELNSLKNHMTYDPQMSYEDFNWSITQYYPSDVGVSAITNILEVASKYGCRLKDAREYITSCYYDQCIDWMESASLWLDYIMMMEKLKLTAKETKKELYPSSLKKAHDVLVFAVKNIYDKEKAKIFDENIGECKHYEYTFGDYMVKAPDSAEDLVKEGIALNHSVAQHIEFVAKGNEFILFIRKKESPDTPFYTVELTRENEIIQVRGNSNHPISEPEIEFFLQKWAKFKKLTIKRT